LESTITTTPAIGSLIEGGLYAGITRGDDGQPSGHLILLPDLPGESMNWQAAKAWAENLGNGARLPTRFESALLYANLNEHIDDDYWYWTGTERSASRAWGQDFSHGSQYIHDKSYEARARAVRLIQLNP
jgi:hypothetical protein